MMTVTQLTSVPTDPAEQLTDRLRLAASFLRSREVRGLAVTSGSAFWTS
jgi:hypothetical protein